MRVSFGIRQLGADAAVAGAPVAPISESLPESNSKHGDRACRAVFRILKHAESAEEVLSESSCRAYSLNKPRRT